jgi:hypothetical protein
MSTETLFRIQLAERHIRDPDHLRTGADDHHVVASYLLMRHQPKATQTLAGDAAASWIG